MEYATIDSVKKDFDQCYAGGDMYPTAMNSKWLLFVNSCGTGFDDGSGKPNGCQEVRTIVEPTLKLNPNNLLEPEISEEEQQAVKDVITKDAEGTNNWQTYKNEELKFQIKYPQDWVYGGPNDNIHFGTPESKTGGYMWGISIYEPSELEKTIAQMGDQFDDRKESRSQVTVNQNITGTMVTITTNKNPLWISKTVYFENNGQLFAIGNGAINDDRFEDFYKSFEVIN
jgi:hypothetical protein